MNKLLFNAKAILLSGGLIILASCPGPASGPDVLGKWTEYAYHTNGTSKVSGVIDFKSEGIFEEDVTSYDYGHKIGGGTWTHDGSILEIHYAWHIYDGQQREDFDGARFLGAVAGKNGTFTLRSADNSWTIEISR
ncbi:MAG: hypothetical protein OEV92_02495 [Nitrospinota bacterium]|nr:hypothetical protein [Nitrospinota bacterium]